MRDRLRGSTGGLFGLSAGAARSLRDDRGGLTR